MFALKLDVDVVICARIPCHHCWQNMDEQVIRLLVHPSRHGVIPNIMETLCPKQFPRFVRLEVSLPHGELQPSDAQWQALWGLVAAPSSVEHLTINFGVLMFCGHTCGMNHLIAALKTPAVALRHITLHGTSTGISMCQLASAVVAISSQLDMLQLMNLGPFLFHGFRNEMLTSKLPFACSQLQFTLHISQFIPRYDATGNYSTNDILVVWDQIFSDPRLRRIVVNVLCVGSDQWPCMKDIVPPPVMVPGRQVTIVLQGRIALGENNFKSNVMWWLERLAGTASTVDVSTSVEQA